MKKSIKRIFTLTSRNLKEIIRDPLSLLFMIGLPIFMEILFYFIFHKLTSQFEMKYLAPGIVVFSQAFLSLFMGMLISLDRNTSFLTRLFVSEAKPYEFIFSYTLSLIPICLVQSVLFFIVGGIIDPSIFKLNMILAIVLALFVHLFMFALFAVFIVMCIVNGGFNAVPVCLIVFDVFMFYREFKKQGLIKRYILRAVRRAELLKTDVER